MADVASMHTTDTLVTANGALPSHSSSLDTSSPSPSSSFASMTAAAAAGGGQSSTFTRRFSMIDMSEDRALPSVQELLAVVKLLQGTVRGNLGARENTHSDLDDSSSTALFDDLEASSFASFRSPSRAPRTAASRNTLLKQSPSFHGIYDPRRLSTSSSAGLVTPPPKRRDSHYNLRSSGQSSVPRPATRVAALTRENISLLPTPHDLSKRRNAAGSVVSGTSQTSKMSARTDGGAVFSRLYQSDYHKTREQKLRAIRDRQENLAIQFSAAGTAAATAHSLNKRLSISSIDSFGSSVGSLASTKTDITGGGVSSRLYDPDYVKKRNARLARLRDERELRDCTFVPTVNKSSSVAAAAAAAQAAAAAERSGARRLSSAHQLQRS